MAPLVIVHGDDLGLAADVNRATIEALDRGALTSASVMVPAPAFREAAAAVRGRGWDIGVHLTLTAEWPSCRWRPVAASARVTTLVAPDGCFWPTAHEATRHADAGEVDAEIRAQIDRAYDAGLAPTHLDTHMFTLLRTPALRAVLARVAADYGVPYFDPLPRANAPAPGSWGRPHLAMMTGRPARTQDAWDRDYAGLVSRLADGVTQLVVHCGLDTPALRAVTGVESFEARCRELDYGTVTGDAFRTALDARGAARACWRDAPAAVPVQAD